MAVGELRDRFDLHAGVGWRAPVAVAAASAVALFGVKEVGLDAPTPNRLQSDAIQACADTLAPQQQRLRGEQFDQACTMYLGSFAGGDVTIRAYDQPTKPITALDAEGTADASGKVYVAPAREAFRAQAMEQAASYADKTRWGILGGLVLLGIGAATIITDVRGAKQDLRPPNN